MRDLPPETRCEIFGLVEATELGIASNAQKILSKHFACWRRK